MVNLKEFISSRYRWFRVLRHQRHIKLFALLLLGICIIQSTIKRAPQVTTSPTTVPLPDIIVLNRNISFNNSLNQEIDFRSKPTDIQKRQSYSMEELQRLGIRLAKSMDAFGEYLPVPKPQISQRRQAFSLEILNQRSQVLHNECEMLRMKFRKKRPMGYKGNLTEYKYRYCGVDHIGKFFWDQVLQDLKNSNNNVSEKMFPSTQERRYSILFVSDPYWRIFSAYIYFVFLPNTLTWAPLRRIIPIGLGNFVKTLDFKRCGNDVSFSEFVQYVISGNKTHTELDNHLKSQTSLCKPCRKEFQFLSKKETFFDDTLIILNQLNLTKNFDLLQNINNKYIDKFSFGALQSVFTDGTGLRRCLSVHDVYWRFWKGLQFLAVIGWDKEFPYSNNDSFSLTKADFVRALKESSVKSLNTLDSTKQRSLILKEAYSSVPLNHIDKIKAMFATDFRTFGYESSLHRLYE